MHVDNIDELLCCNRTRPRIDNVCVVFSLNTYNTINSVKRYLFELHVYESL